jgi:predicted nucleic acid-binding protein
VSELTPGTGLLDTSVLASQDDIPILPAEASISMLSLAELTAGPHATADLAERGRRQERLQVIEAFYDALPFDAECARAYGRVYAEAVLAGRKARGRRAVDLMIAATAVANELPLYTLNAADLRGLEPILEIVDCGVAAG